MDFLIHSILNASPFFVYILVALVLLLESSAIPIANTTLLLLTGALASLGHLNIYILALTAILGSITGACLAYLLGIKGGRKVLLRLATRFRVDPQKIVIAENWIQGAGVWMVFLSRMIPYVRPFACLPFGISGMPFRRFLVAALSGSIVWCAGILSIGWILGPRCILALRLVETYTVPALCVLTLLIAITVLVQYRVNRYIRFKLSSTVALQDSQEQQSSRDTVEI